MNSSASQRKSISSFSVILIMIVAMIAGAAMVPMLNVQYSPQRKQQSLTVSFSYQGSARVVESEVTSLLEGALNTIDGVSNTEAVSQNGGGYISLQFKDNVNMETARFEVSTHLRQIKNKLPQGVNPYISGNTSGNGDKVAILEFTINADMPPDAIVHYANEHIVTPLSQIEGVEEVSTSGAEPFQWIITFDPNLLRSVGLSPNDIRDAFGNSFQNTIVGTEIVGNSLMLVRLKSGDGQDDIENITIKDVNGRVYRIGDFARVTYEEQLPSSYNRINGLNTIDITVFGSQGINTINVVNEVKAKIETLKADFPNRFAIEKTYDAAEPLKKEINKILFRSLLSLGILLLFVLLVSRSLKYLTVIGLTIAVNLLTAVIMYCLLDIDIELYSMAGITVSLGIIIDTAIVIADHYTYYGNRKVITSIAGALFTTIAALLAVFFLPEQQQQNLNGFVWVIIINLSLSLIVAYLFVPALLDKMPLRQKGVANSSIRHKKRLLLWTGKYERLIVWGRSHRWIFIVAMILGFGVPINLLPSSVHHDGYEEYDEHGKKGGLVEVYNKTIGGKWYQNHKNIFEYALGGSFNIFSKNLGGFSSYYREARPERILDVYANMPEGCTVQQLNDIIVQMENWLSQFDEISSFRTQLYGTQGRIEIRFKKEYEYTYFPYRLKEQLWRKACGYGGATWQISALDENDRTLSNSVYRTSWSNAITLRGYNYDMLTRFAEELIDSLKNNRRISDAGFSANWNSFVSNEFCLDIDRKKITQNNINLNSYFSFLNNQLFDQSIGNIFDGKQNTQVKLVSDERNDFDLWHIKNDMIDIDSVKTRLNDIGSIVKRRTGLDIHRINQEYEIKVGYEFVGSWELRSKMEQKQLKRLNASFPMGFRAKSSSYYWSSQQKRQQAGLLFLIVVMIFMICSALFESLKKALTIIMMIPVAFIGLFLSYPLFGVTFDQGGYAAMIMLSGIVVNAGIYLTSEYDTIGRLGKNSLRTYLKAYNRKIIPTLLTIVSTILGLIPFLFDGNDDVFWYAFAIGVIGGMLFSIIALVLFMPVFFALKAKKEHPGSSSQDR